MTIQERVWKTGMWVGVILAIFLAVLVIKELKALPSAGKDVPIYNSISVNGKGEAVSIPDIATFSFSVNESAKTVEEAQSKATTKINSAIDAVKAEGVAENDIKTLAYNINPKYEYQNAVCPAIATVGSAYYCPPGKSVLTGYEVSQTIQVKIREIAKAGGIFTKIGSLGVQNVNSLVFSVDDIETVKAEARTVAIEDAKNKAEILAKQLGVRLVRITSFYDQGDQPIYYGREGFGGDELSIAKVSNAPAPQLPTGEQKITSNVTITYEIR